MEDIMDVVKYMLSQNFYSPMQIQKMLYYAYALYLIKYNDSYSENAEKLFKADFYAGKNGPINHKVYNHMKKSEMPYYKENKEYHLKSEIHENYIKKILAVFGKYSGNELAEITKTEDPWLNAYIPGQYVKIKDENIFDYFSKKFKNIE